MKVLIQPVRCIRQRWKPCSFDQAQAYDVLQATGKRAGKRLRRCQSRAEAEQLAAKLDSTRTPRSREAVLGCRWSDVVEEVTSRRRQVIARSLTTEEYLRTRGGGGFTS